MLKKKIGLIYERIAYSLFKPCVKLLKKELEENPIITNNFNTCADEKAINELGKVIEKDNEKREEEINEKGNVKSLHLFLFPDGTYHIYGKDGVQRNYRYHSQIEEYVDNNDVEIVFSQFKNAIIV